MDISNSQVYAFLKTYLYKESPKFFTFKFHFLFADHYQQFWFGNYFKQGKLTLWTDKFTGWWIILPSGKKNLQSGKHAIYLFNIVLPVDRSFNWPVI